MFFHHKRCQKIQIQAIHMRKISSETNRNSDVEIKDEPDSSPRVDETVRSRAETSKHLSIELGFKGF